MYIRNFSWFKWILCGCLALQACKPIMPADSASATMPANHAALTLTLTTGESPTRYAPIEFVMDGLPEVSNPFDASEIDLHIYLTSPTGSTITVGAFWYQEYQANGSQTPGKAGWRARFTPSISGDWRATARLKPHGLTSNEVSFTVTESEKLGFVRVDPDGPRFFAYEDGTRFLPIGLNMGWWDDDPIEDYRRWLDHFAASGGNTIRVWMANWAFALEWNDTPLGDYRHRMKQAWFLDELLRLADERGVKVILVLNHHGQFSRTVNPQWNENPYNIELGGPLQTPEDFATDATAIALFQQRLRYIVDRWGAAPNLLAWEWWNEYNFTPMDDSMMEAWLTTMDSYLAERDPYDHLVTISGPAGHDSPIWQLPGIDFVSVHIYSTDDPLHLAADLNQEYAPAVPDKPLLLAEFGYATGEETVDSYDKTGIHLHNGLWATFFSGQAGSGMYWWWDTYIEPLDLWYHFGALSRFLESIDPAEFAASSVAITTDEEGETNGEVGAEALLLKGDGQHLLWVRSKQYTAAAVDEAYNAAVLDALRKRETLGEFIYTPSPVAGHRAEIDDVKEGKHQVQWFDPQTGAWGEVSEIEAADGILSIPLPAFSLDIAAKIEPLP